MAFEKKLDFEPADSALKQLIEIVPPPSNRKHRGLLEGFEPTEAALGIELPLCYKELIHVYGHGVWFENFHILNPFVRDRNDSRIWWCRGLKGGPAWCDDLRRMRDKSFESLYPISPSLAGYFLGLSFKMEAYCIGLPKVPGRTGKQFTTPSRHHLTRSAVNSIYPPPRLCLASHNAIRNYAILSGPIYLAANAHCSHFERWQTNDVHVGPPPVTR